MDIVLNNNTITIFTTMIYSTSFDEADMVSASVQTQVFKTRLYHYVDTLITSKFCSSRYHRINSQ